VGAVGAVGASDSDLDSSLWISAHSELLLKRSEEFAALSRDLELLNQMCADLRELIGEQQEPLDRAEQHLLGTRERVVQAETSLHEGASMQRRSLWLKAGLCVLVGGSLGAGIGGIGLLVGLKPLAALALGGGCSILVSGVVAGR
jgi:hypothetical protein